MSKIDEYVHIDEFSNTYTVRQEKIGNITNEDIELNSYAYALDDTSERKKKVRFPDDNELVSHYFESKNYWIEHKFCSSEELINSYKKACDQCNTRPIPILLEQLKGIDAELCHERYDMLNMSNVKLDLKHIECMEEVFKRVQFKTLNFENSCLDDESSASLFEIIEFYESCLKLNISMNSKISYNGFSAFSKMLKKTPALESIDLKGIMFTDTTIPPLNRALRCGSNLKILHMENSNICSKNLLILSSALKLNIHLKELHLSSNRMVPSDGIQLGSLLKVNRHIQLLDVRNNSLGDIGLSHICDGLCEQMIPQPNKADEENQGSGLLCLILWCNSITHNGMPALSEALKANKSLQSLNLGNNPISSEGIHSLRDGLLVNRSLLRLSLPCCRISCEGGVAIAEYLADTKQLMRLDLRDNDIRTAGLMAISHSMKVNKSLLRLDLDQVSKRDPVRSLNVKGFMDTQLESLRLIQEKIQENKLAVMKNQEIELAHTIQGLSNNPQDTGNTAAESTIPMPGISPDSDIPQLANSSSPPLSPETISGIVNCCPEDIESTDSNLVVQGSGPQHPNMSLNLSKDMDTSFDSPSAMSNRFSNKVLSPTDTILEFSLSDDPVNIIVNSTTEDEDLFLVNINNSEKDATQNQSEQNEQIDFPKESVPQDTLSFEQRVQKDFTILSLSLPESDVQNGSAHILLNDSNHDSKSPIDAPSQPQKDLRILESSLEENGIPNNDPLHPLDDSTHDSKLPVEAEIQKDNTIIKHPLDDVVSK